MKKFFLKSFLFILTASIFTNLNCVKKTELINIAKKYPYVAGSGALLAAYLFCKHPRTLLVTTLAGGAAMLWATDEEKEQAKKEQAKEKKPRKKQKSVRRQSQIVEVEPQEAGAAQKEEIPSERESLGASQQKHLATELIQEELERPHAAASFQESGHRYEAQHIDDFPSELVTEEVAAYVGEEEAFCEEPTVFETPDLSAFGPEINETLVQYIDLILQSGLEYTPTLTKIIQALIKNAEHFNVQTQDALIQYCSRNSNDPVLETLAFLASNFDIKNLNAPGNDNVQGHTPLTFFASKGPLGQANFDACFAAGLDTWVANRDGLDVNQVRQQFEAQHAQS